MTHNNNYPPDLNTAFGRLREAQYLSSFSWQCGYTGGIMYSEQYHYSMSPERYNTRYYSMTESRNRAAPLKFTSEKLQTTEDLFSESKFLNELRHFHAYKGPDNKIYDYDDIRNRINTFQNVRSQNVSIMQHQSHHSQPLTASTDYNQLVKTEEFIDDILPQINFAISSLPLLFTTSSGHGDNIHLYHPLQHITHAYGFGKNTITTMKFEKDRIEKGIQESIIVDELRQTNQLPTFYNYPDLDYLNTFKSCLYIFDFAFGINKPISSEDIPTEQCGQKRSGDGDDIDDCLKNE